MHTIDTETITRDLTDKGLLIEAGFASLRAMAFPSGAPAEQIEELRNFFFAGARHLFSSIMTVLEPGADPTTADLLRLSLISQELDRFITDFSARRLTTKGNA